MAALSATKKRRERPRASSPVPPQEHAPVAVEQPALPAATGKRRSKAKHQTPADGEASTAAPSPAAGPSGPTPPPARRGRPPKRKAPAKDPRFRQTVLDSHFKAIVAPQADMTDSEPDEEKVKTRASSPSSPVPGTSGVAKKKKAGKPALRRRSPRLAARILPRQDGLSSEGEPSSNEDSGSDWDPTREQSRNQDDFFMFGELYITLL